MINIGIIDHFTQAVMNLVFYTSRTVIHPFLFVIFRYKYDQLVIVYAFIR